MPFGSKTTKQRGSCWRLSAGLSLLHRSALHDAENRRERGGGGGGEEGGASGGTDRLRLAALSLSSALQEAASLSFSSLPLHTPAFA